MDILFEKKEEEDCGLYTYTLVESAPCTRTIYHVGKNKNLPDYEVQKYADEKGTRIRAHFPYVQYLVQAIKGWGGWKGRGPFVTFSLEPFTGSEKIYLPPLKNIGSDGLVCGIAAYGDTSREAVVNAIHQFWNTTFNDDIVNLYRDQEAFWKMANPGWYNNFEFTECYTTKFIFGSEMPVVRREPL